MKFSRFKSLGLFCVMALAMLLLAEAPPRQNAHIRHGLRVFIDPSSGEFQRPDQLPETEASGNSLLGMASGLFPSTARGEVRSVNADGGYRIKLKQYYRPTPRSRAGTGS